MRAANDRPVILQSIASAAGYPGGKCVCRVGSEKRDVTVALTACKGLGEHRIARTVKSRWLSKRRISRQRDDGA